MDRRALWTFLPLTLFLANGLYGQADPTPSASAFDAYISEAFDEIGVLEGSPRADSVQNAYATEFFRYHLSHPASDTGWRAGWLSFMLWWHTGSAERMDEAQERLQEMLEGGNARHPRYGLLRPVCLEDLQRFSRHPVLPVAAAATSMARATHPDVSDDDPSLTLRLLPR